MDFDVETTCRTISAFGGANPIVPLGMVSALLLGLTGHGGGARRWGAAIVAMSALIFVWKVIFHGWNYGIAALDFGAPSGHAALASAVLPVLCGWLSAGQRPGLNRAGFAAGWVLATMVAISRIPIGAHSPAEAIAGWLLGSSVSLVALRSLDRPLVPPRAAITVICLVAALLAPAANRVLPREELPKKVARHLNGSGRIYERADLHAALPVRVPAPRG